MLCPKCGKELKEGAVFCSKCGCNLNTEIWNKKKKKKKKMFAVMATAFAAIIVVAVSVMAVNVLGQTDEEKLQKQLSLGDKYLEELNYDKAIVAYNKAIAIEPKNVDAVCGLAMAYAGNSDYDQAVEVMETFLTLAESESYKKNQEKAYATLAQIYYDEDEISDALYMSGGTLREAQNAH